MKTSCKLISGKKITIVGAGGTGCHIIYQLAKLKARITIIDRDIIEPTNLDRQFLFSKKDIGKPKAETASKNISSTLKTKFHFEDLDRTNIAKIIKMQDLVFDCTDNIDTRLLLNDYCSKYKIPWIHTSAEGNIGQAMLILPSFPCYQCIFGEKHGEGCDSRGVELNILKETSDLAVNLCANYFSGTSLFGLYRITTEGTQQLALKKNANCNACRNKFNYLEGRARVIGKLCGHNRFLIDLKKNLNLSELATKIKGDKIITKDALISSEFTIMKKGKVLIRASTQTEAKKKFSRILSI